MGMKGGGFGPRAAGGLSLLEMLLVLAAVVGVVIIAVLVPLYDLTNAIG